MVIADPATAYLVAGICLSGLQLAIKGLKGLFKWIRRWLARKLKLKQYIAMVEYDRNRQTQMLADNLRHNKKAWRKAQSYAMAVQAHAGNPTSGAKEEDELDGSDFETGSEWDGESCPGSEVPDSDYELDESSNAGDSDDDGGVGSPVYRSSDEEEENSEEEHLEEEEEYSDEGEGAHSEEHSDEEGDASSPNFYSDSD